MRDGRPAAARLPGVRRLFGPLAAVLLLAGVSARAHDVSYAHAEVRWLPNRIEVALTVHQDDAAAALGVPMPEWFLEDAFLSRAGPALADSLRRRFALRADGRVVAWRYAGARRDPLQRGVTLSLVAPLAGPVASLEVVGRCFRSSPTTRRS
jgi:hypothetical protein